MANNCSINIKADKLPIVLKKVEYYMFKALDRSGISFLQLPKTNVDEKLQLLENARLLLEEDILLYSKKAVKLKDTEEGALYESFAQNLQGINANWSEASALFLKHFGGIINLRTKFRLDEAGLIDLDETVDEEEALNTKFVYDQPANEIDPVDNIDKGIELFLRSITKKDVFDDYGFNVLVDYGSFVRRLSTDLENTVNTDEIISRLETLKTSVPEYQQVLDKLQFKPTDNADDLQFKINFRNSFAKALIPIYVTSLENGVVKVIEATTAKKNAYEQRVNSNFFRRGMPVTVNGKKVNLASKEGGVWVLTKSDLSKLQKFMDEKSIPAGEITERKIQFLEALGFEFSPESRELLKKVSNLNTVVKYIYDHTVRILEKGDRIKSPIDAISKTVFINKKKYQGQRGNLNIITNFEIKYNKSFNTERSIVNQDGNRQHAIQHHNNFTIVNKFLSDPQSYPTLQSIIQSEPSMFWLDPIRNPSIANSVLLNSLFYYSPQDPNFGARRRVTKNEQGVIFSPTEGEFVTISVTNTGGMQMKDERGLKSDSAGSTSLTSVDKLIQDINMFMFRGITSVQRLSDKATDLGVSLNYYIDPVTGAPVQRILGGATNYESIFNTDQFLESTLNALRDVMKSAYLAKNGFYDELAVASKTIMSPSNFGVFTSILSGDVKSILNSMIDNAVSVEDIDNMILENTDEREVILFDIQEYMTEYRERFKDLLNPVLSLVPTTNIFGADGAGKAKDVDNIIDYYLANTFLQDIENLKVFFGDSSFFKAFHKRSSKDSATGIFTIIDDAIIERFNNYSDAQGYGANTNLGGRMLAERLYDQGVINNDSKNSVVELQQVSKSFRSGVISDVNFKSSYIKNIKDNIERLRSQGLISDENYKLYKDNLQKVISESYNGVEADGQGKCTFDFYRIMSILTSDWSREHEDAYKKITLYAHYQSLVESEKDEAKRAEYLMKRDAVGYDPLLEVYFPPKKFQYSGPMEYSKAVNGQEYGQMIPVFDKFSLQPLIPTIIKGTADEHLANKMMFNGVGYVKFESGTKVESPKNKDSYYAEYNESNPQSRSIYTLEQMIEMGRNVRFKSEQTLFFNHLKQQVRIDSNVHLTSIFGSQIRKLVLSNILGMDTEFNKSEFVRIYNKYTGLINSLIRAEKRDLYAKMGVRENADRELSISNIKKLVQFFFEEIDKKNQDSNVRRALNYNEETGQFEIPLDGSVQAQIIEGIIISSLNNRIVRHRTNGSMLTQVAITGSERVQFSKEKSKEALKTFGNTELKYYDVIEENGKLTVTPMQVKIGLTPQWRPLLNLKHIDGNPIGSIERLNEMLKNDTWKKRNKESIRLTAYRIPTQGLNFSEVMEVAEFLPAAFGDAIILPSEIVIKTGSDFDIDKMFVFYPNLVTEGENSGTVVKDGSKQSIENELFATMQELILHPSNYMQLVTPSTSFHIMPTVNKIYKKLYGKEREQTDYKDTQLIDRDYNIRKFKSLLTGKNDLGIAAIANTFNVLFQLSNAVSSSQFLETNEIRTLLKSPSVIKDRETDKVLEIKFGNIYDQDGMYKSEFFAEFISAFVDVAKDDYVFAINVVTELSPLIFSMKFQGYSTESILAFINQPAIRDFTKNLAKYNSMIVDTYLESEKKRIAKIIDTSSPADIEENEQIKVFQARLEKLKYSARRKALSETLKNLGFGDIKPYRKSMFNFLTKNNKKLSSYSGAFTQESLMDSIKPDEFDVSMLSQDQKLSQLAMLFELENQKIISDSMTETESFLNFDTKPHASSFDAYLRNSKYMKAKAGGSILSIDTINTIKDLSPIAPLNIGKEIVSILESAFPIRNNRKINAEVLEAALAARQDPNIINVRTEDDMNTLARTFKNDFMSYILYNYLDKSEAGREFFKKEFNTDKTFVEYMKELVETPKLLDLFNKVKDDLSVEDYQELIKMYPFIQNIVPKSGEKNTQLVGFKLVENSSHTVDKESVIAQFEDAINLTGEESKDVRMFLRNLALYSTFQSGYNYGEFSYIAVTPINLINKLYGEAVQEFNRASSEQKNVSYRDFKDMFRKNNPVFYAERSSINPMTGELSKQGKWYASGVNLDFTKNIPKVGNPLIDAGVKPTDMNGNAAKDVVMASESTQFIGFKSGSAAISSTDKYRLAWGDKANTGKYTSSDVVMVSASGVFRGVTREEVIKTFESKYVPILNKAMEVGVSFRVGNQYDKGNLGDFLVADHLRKNGYVEQKFEGYSRWFPKKSDQANEFLLADSLAPIQQNFADSATRRMRPEFAGKSTMDLIISGDRTRTTRAKTDISRMLKDYNLSKISELVGKVIRMTDQQGRVVYTKITSVNEFTQQYQDKTWMKEGWTKEVTDSLVGKYPYAIEFEVVRKPASSAEPLQKPTDLTSKIDAWVSSELPWSIETPSDKIAKMYENEKLTGETIEEFLHRMSCLGKLK